MNKVISLVIIIMCAAVSISAQSSSKNGRERKNHVEDKSARLVKVPAAEDAFVPHISYSYSSDEFKPGVIQVGPRTTYLKEGLTTQEVVRLLGNPSAVNERNENDIVVAVYEFPRGEGRVLIAEFVKNTLVRSMLETRGQKTT